MVDSVRNDVMSQVGPVERDLFELDRIRFPMEVAKGKGKTKRPRPAKVKLRLARLSPEARRRLFSPLVVAQPHSAK